MNVGPYVDDTSRWLRMMSTRYLLIHHLMEVMNEVNTYTA